MEKFESIIKNIDDPNVDIDINATFNFARFASSLLLSTDKDEQDQGRKIIIRVLSNWEKVRDDCKDIWYDLIRKAGFYPYIKQKGLDNNKSLYSSIEFEAFASEHNDKYYHLKQKQLFDTIVNDKKNLLVSAPTSFGKSFLIEEIVASKRYENILIIQPTLALIAETRRNLKKYSDHYNIVIRTTQRQKSNQPNIFIFTAERVLEYDDFPKLDFFVLDEFYKISNAFLEDRRDILNSAVFNVLHKHKPQFYFIGPFIENVSSEFLQKYNAEFLNVKYSLVDVDTFHLKDKKGKTYKVNDREGKVTESLNNINPEEQTIFYCSSVNMTFQVARVLKEKIQKPKKLLDLSLIEWAEKNIWKEWEFPDFLKYGIGIHNASLPKHITNTIIDYFNNGYIKYLVCTSTIIEGVNTSAKNIVIMKNHKGSNPISMFDYKNIRGRAGRLMKHFVGNLYVFHEISDKDVKDVDIPFIDQDKPFSQEIMIQLPEDMIKDKNCEEFKFINSLSDKCKKTFRHNGLSVEGQYKIYQQLKKDMDDRSKRSLIYWENPIFPTKVCLEYVFNICWNAFQKTNRPDHCIKSAKHLATCVSMYKGWHSFMLLESVLNDQQKTLTKNKLIVNIFDVISHWFQYKVPKWLTTFNEIQKLVADEYKMKEANYIALASSLEQDFLGQNTSLLMEYGIPSSAISKINNRIPKDIDEDEVINWLKENKSKILENSNLLQYEKEKLVDIA
ncbi:MAG: DEAD/DEAH box helicase [Alphaproteobacteria bacterium]|nr:DEAD/DEAH box helicase [Alphaproteobacteria bacterium]